jgi:hypothetical protein
MLGSDVLNAVFGPGAKAAAYFSTEAERREFWRTEERKKITELIAGLPPGPILNEVYEIDIPNKRVTVRSGTKPARVLPISE